MILEHKRHANIAYTFGHLTGVLNPANGEPDLLKIRDVAAVMRMAIFDDIGAAGFFAGFDWPDLVAIATEAVTE